MLTKKKRNLNDIVVFGSMCTVHLHTNNKSMGMRGKAGVIIGKDDETKGYRVYLANDRVVVVTQHAKNIETLIDAPRAANRRMIREELKVRRSLESKLTNVLQHVCVRMDT